MKKILSLGAAAAVLSLTAVAASAAITPKFSTDAPVSGETVTVEIVAEGMTQSATQFVVKASENLTFVSAEKTTTGFAEFSETTNRFAWAASDVPADGTVLLTLTYTVDAAADEEISVSLVPDEGFTDISADAVAAVVVDGASGDVSNEEPTFEPTTEEPSSEDPGVVETPTTDEPSSDEGGNQGDNNDNPITGVPLAVVPAVLAGAAIVVAKKRK